MSAGVAAVSAGVANFCRSLINVMKDESFVVLLAQMSSLQGPMVQEVQINGKAFPKTLAK